MNHVECTCFCSNTLKGKYDKTLFSRWHVAWNKLLHVLNEERCEFLASNMEHDMLVDEQRKRRSNPKALAKDLKEACKDSLNISQREANAGGPKHSFLTGNYSNNNKVSDTDLEFLKRMKGDVKHKEALEAFLRTGEKKLSPYNIQRPDGTTLAPEEYPHFHSNGAIGAPIIDLIRLHCRRKRGVAEQHSVVWSASGMILLTNGRAPGGSLAPINVMDVLKSSSGTEPSVEVETPTQEIDFSDESDSDDDAEEQAAVLKRKAGIDAKAKASTGNRQGKRVRTN